MSDVIIHPLNNVYCKVQCEPHITQELSEFFCFEPENSRFDPTVRGKKWDGKIRLFRKRGNTIYAGLVRHLIKFCEMHEYTYENKTDYIGKENIDHKFHLKLGLEPKFEVRDYQVAGYSYACTRKRCVLLSPTASGKSLIAFIIINYWLSKGKKNCLLVVPTISLVHQMFGDFKDYGLDSDKYCQMIFEGQDQNITKPITISTWQSLAPLPEKYFEKFDFIIGDEAHTFAAKSLRSIMERLVNCDVRIGMSGTLKDTKVHKLILEGLFGPIAKTATTRELMDRGYLADLSIQCVVLKYPIELAAQIKGWEYKDEIEFLFGLEIRNDFISKFCMELEGNTLVLFSYVEKHGQILYEKMCALHPTRKVFFIHGKVEGEEREEIRKIVNSEKNAVIVASFGTMSTGSNIPNLDNLVLAAPTKSKIRTLQSIGRSLRKSETKSSATLYDIVDDLRFGTYVNYSIKHFDERIKMYNSEKFTFKLISKRI